MLFWIYMGLAGRAAMLTDTMGRGTASEYWMLRPNAIEVKTTKSGIPEKYRYTTGNGIIEYPAELVWDFKYPHPLREQDGASPTLAARWAINLELASSKHWIKFFKTGAVPTLLLSRAGGLDPVVLKTFIEQVRQNFGNENKSVSVAGMTGDWKAQELGISPRDADFVEGYRMVQQIICSAYGVPPSKIGISARGGLNATNTDEDEQLYWSRIKSKLQRFERGFNETVIPRMGLPPGSYVKHDLSKVPALRKLQLQEAQTYATLIAGGVYSPNEAAEALDMASVVGGDQRFLPINLQAIGAVKPEVQLVQPARQVGARAKTSLHPETYSAEEKARAIKRAAATARLDHLETRTSKTWQTALEAQAARIVKRVGSKGKAFKDSPDLADAWDDEVELSALRSVALRVIGSIVNERGQQAMDDVDPAKRFMLSHSRVVRYIEQYAADQVKAINATTRDALNALLRLGVEENWSLGQLQTAIAEAPEFSLSRALAIARTETTSAYNAATVEAWRQSEVVTNKEWLTAEDDHVRDSHRECEAQGPIGLDEVFSNGLPFPGAPSGDASEVVNCRCTLLPVVEASRSIRFGPELRAKWDSRGNGKPHGSASTLAALTAVER